MRRRRSPPPEPPVDEAFEQRCCGIAWDKGADPKTDPLLIGDVDYLLALRFFATMQTQQAG